MARSPPPQDNDPIITQFRPVNGQWELNDHNLTDFDPSGGTILHNYCRFITTTPLIVFRYLIETKGCDINACDDYQNIPFYIALRDYNTNEQNGIDVLIYLLSFASIDVNEKKQHNWTLLHSVCLKINTLPIEVYRYVMEIKGGDLNVKNVGQQTPLLFAFQRFQSGSNNIEALMYLLNCQGVDVNIASQNNETVLHKVCQKIDLFPLNMFKFLIETKGADLYIEDGADNTPLHYAFTQFKDGSSDVNKLTYLLGLDCVDVNKKGPNGVTLLHQACTNINGLPVIVFKELIEVYNADINCRDQFNNTPLNIAINRFNGGSIDTLIYLLSLDNVNVNLKGTNGLTLMHSACQNINNIPITVFKYLIEVKCGDINIQNFTNFTPLHFAIELFRSESDNSHSLLYLLNINNINIDLKTKMGHNLLHKACNHTQIPPIEVFKALADGLGAKFDCDTHSKNPLHLLLSDRYHKSDNDLYPIVECLIQYVGGIGMGSK
jgi:ankyrin repeat protein